MLRSIKDITKNYKLLAKDGEIGKVNDFFFNDMLWNVRYLVADTGSWLHEQLVLISPKALGQPDWATEDIPVKLTKKKIENSPPVEKHQPISKQRESELAQYYAWPMSYSYGVDSAHFAEMELMAKRLQALEEENKDEKNKSEKNVHLRSTDEVLNYSIKAKDGSIGHVDDFIVEDTTWIIRYMVVDTRNWLPGQKVLVSPEWIKNIDWAAEVVEVNLDKESIKNSPEYDPSDPVNRAYESQLYDYYGRPNYWDLQ
jgi:hypothetical protein